MPTVTRITSTGTLLVNGTFDEVNGPIVTDGLRLWLEAANPNSYPGTGTAWTDLSGNGNNGTLNNGVGFDSFNGGLVFDGSNDYVDLNTNNIITGTNPFTFSCFYTITAVNGGGEIFGNYGVGYTTNYLWIAGEYGVYLDNAVYFPGAPISAGTYHMAVTRDASGLVILYKNGVQVNSGTLASSIAVGPNFRLGADVTGSATVGGERLNGKIYQQLVYNRALTAAEITQNYNARRQVFALEATSSTTVVGKISINTNTVFASEFDEFTGAPVVDSSLKLWLDAGQTTSYPGTGTTWTDLSGSGTNGTLTSGPTYNASNGGSIVFDGVDDLVTVSDKGNLPVFTVEAWVNFISVPTNPSFPAIIANIYTGSPAVLNFSLGFNGTDTFGVWDGKIKIGFYDGTWRSTDGIIPTTNTWYHLVGTYDGSTLSFYINSVLSYTKSYVGTPSSSGAGIRIGRRWDTANYINGYIPLVKLYNRALSSAEIVQNYNALQSRYGLPSITSTQMPVVQRQQSSGTLLVNGEFDEFTGAPVVDSSLVLWLDAGQTSSYSGSGSTWTDLSGNGNNGTLVNSPTFISTDGGGCIQLDGSNDHITLPITGFAPASLTIDYWIKRISDNGYFWLIDNNDQPELRMIFQSSGKLQIYFYDDGAYFSTALSSTTFSTGLWYNITATLTNSLQNVYINGNQEIITTTGTYTGGPSGNAGEHTLGTYNRPSVGYGGYANVRIGSYKFYNRVLTTDEIATNFNALRGRYGI